MKAYLDYVTDYQLESSL